MNIKFSDIIGLAGILIAQLMLLDYMTIGAMLFPWLFALPLASLPLRMDKSLLLFIAFALGFIYDVVTLSYGPHTIALPLLIMLRPAVVGLFTFRGGAEIERMTLGELGLVKFLFYLFVFAWIHQFTALAIDYFSIAGLFKALIRGFGGAIYSVGLYTGFKLIFQRSSR